MGSHIQTFLAAVHRHTHTHSHGSYSPLTAIMYKPSRIIFRRQEACESSALDFSTLEPSIQGEEADKDKERTEEGKEQGGWMREVRERQLRRPESDTATQRKF